MKKKNENELMVVTYNQDRNSILNDESWVNTDSLNVAKTIGVEHKEIMRKTRKIFSEYGFGEVGEKTPPTENIEFIHRNTDFTYSICYYKDKQGKLREHYKLSKDLLMLVLFSFKTDNAKEFHKLYIAKFNAMEKELAWYRSRYLGIVTRNSITDAIKDQYNHEWNRKTNIYADFTDLVYLTLYGVKASQIRKLNSEKFKKNSKGILIGNIREWLKDDDIKLVDDLEKEICTLIKYNFTYDQIINMLNNRYKTFYNLVLNYKKRETN